MSKKQSRLKLFELLQVQLLQKEVLIDNIKVVFDLVDVMQIDNMDEIMCWCHTD